MAVVSLIVPIDPPGRIDGLPLDAWRRNLEAAGHEVELILVAAGPCSEPDAASARIEKFIANDSDSLAAAAIRGLEAAEGEVVLVLDPTMGYEPGCLAAIAAPLEAGVADIATANRFLVQREGEAAPKPGGGKPGAALHSTIRALAATSDPFTGLIGVTRSALERSDHKFSPAGSKFSFEILAKIEGIVAEIPARRLPRSQRPKPARAHLFSLDEARHLKRLADHRWGNLSRLIQFCVVGASGMVVDLSCYATFQLFFDWTRLLAGKTVPLVGGSLALAVSGALSIAIALSWNFSLNRRLTFSYARTGSLPRQFLTYALSNSVGALLSLSVRLALPRYVGFFDNHKLAAAVVGIVLATGISFTLSRWVVFGSTDEKLVEPVTASY